MYRKPYLVLLALLVLAAGFILLMAQKPGEAKSEAAAQTALPTAVGEVTQAVESVTPDMTAEVEMSAAQVREALVERAKQHLFKPGWVLVRETLTNFTNREEYVVVPMNGQIIPKNWVRETWLLVDKDLKVVAGYSVVKNPEGEPLHETIVSDGTFGKAIQPEDLPGWQVDHWLYLDLFDRMIEYDGGKSASLSLIEQDASRRLRVFTQDFYPSPGFTDGVDGAIVSSFSTSHYNWETGQFLFSEDWAVLTDGSYKQINHLKMEVEYPPVLPADVIAQFAGEVKE
ncbi:MAG: hypothetical protein AB1457_13590 [Chloroflexota bacterium]|nr:MAG: hypothetical protein KatS3mg045_0431 [Bellilinea sp.]